MAGSGEVAGRWWESQWEASVGWGPMALASLALRQCPALSLPTMAPCSWHCPRCFVSSSAPGRFHHHLTIERFKLPAAAREAWGVGTEWEGKQSPAANGLQQWSGLFEILSLRVNNHADTRSFYSGKCHKTLIAAFLSPATPTRLSLLSPRGGRLLSTR